MFNLRISLAICITCFTGITACKVNKNNTTGNTVVQNQAPPITVKATRKGPYRETAARVLDIIHMQLAVKFDYKNQHVPGKVVLTCKPYFYDIKTAVLDARNFNINKVALLGEQDTMTLKYQYDGERILIFLDKTYKRNETFRLFIDYVAKPNEIKGARGVAITDDKGLYFINPLGTEKDKPRQIWTQGETQSNSCWFPIVDAPNEKITQEIAITVDDHDITLSNGELMMSKNNPDGSRTDYWRQNKPHAPYLVMLAVGSFERVKDYWRDSVEVDYYVETKYKPYARMIFGNTPEMMELFSKKLGVDYPWDKYAQIVVRDFVSGAMENTSAVVHGGALQHDAREHLDHTHEDVVSHELFHHWFGDLVTCESWSNLPLNESFATYGEYIWSEYKYGSMEADLDFNNNLRAYLGQKNKHKVEPIRYHYSGRDDMFDVVSYQKGGGMLHMLRRNIGDEAFFEGLKLYLTRYAYKTAEIADLRMVFEEVTGQDLNWFFNQWFLKAGHPSVEYSYEYTSDRKKVTLTITQKQDSSWGVYRLPLKVDVYTSTGKEREQITVTEREQKFEFSYTGPVRFLIVDADETLVGNIDDRKTAEEFRLMIKEGPLYMDKYYGVKGWSEMLGDSLSAEDRQVISYLLANEFWGIRRLGLDVCEKLDSFQFSGFEAVVNGIALKDTKAANRSDAVALLAANHADAYRSTFEKLTGDSAYSVVGASLSALHRIDPAVARKYMQPYRTVENAGLQTSIASIVSENGEIDEVQYFESLFGKFGYHKYVIMAEYIAYLQVANKAIQQKAITGLRTYYQSADETTRIVMKSWIRNLQAPWKDKIASLEESKNAAKKKPAMLQEIDTKIREAQAMVDEYQSVIN